MSHILKKASNSLCRQKLYVSITDQVVYGLYKSMKKYEAAASSFPERHTPAIPHRLSVRVRNVTELDRYIFQMTKSDTENVLMGLSEYITESLGTSSDVEVRIAAGLPYQSEINVTLDKDYFERA